MKYTLKIILSIIIIVYSITGFGIVTFDKPWKQYHDAITLFYTFLGLFSGWYYIAKDD